MVNPKPRESRQFPNDWSYNNFFLTDGFLTDSVSTIRSIQSLKALIENADAVYEKIVHCQKAGKCELISFL